VRRLWPDPEDELDDAALAATYAYPDALTRPWIRSNMVMSLDGAAAGATGSSRDINGTADIRVFGTLRALADAVVVGASTALTEGYGPARVRSSYASLRASSGQPPTPVLVLVTSRGTLDVSARAFSEPAFRPLVVTCAADVDPALSAVADVAHVPAASSGSVDVRALVDLLASRGRLRVLCEGGPRLLGSLIAADLVDDYCLTTSPRIVGGVTGHGDSPVRPVVGGLLTSARPFELAHLLSADEFVFSRYVKAPS